MNVAARMGQVVISKWRNGGTEELKMVKADVALDWSVLSRSDIGRNRRRWRRVLLMVEMLDETSQKGI